MAYVKFALPQCTEASTQYLLLDVSQYTVAKCLVAIEEEFRNTADWQLDKVAYSTILQMSFLYIFAGIVAFVTFKYAK